MGFTCESCGLTQSVNWYEPQLFPSQPVTPNVGEGFWVPVAISQTCKCGTSSLLDVPVRKIDSTWDLYGDEAERKFEPRELPGITNRAHFFCISLAGLHVKGRAWFDKKVNRLKSKARPDRAPESWNIHLTEIWNTPPGESGYSFQGKADKVRFGLDLANIMSKARPHLFTLNVSGCRVQGDDESWADTVKLNKQHIFATTLLTSLDQFRHRNLNIRWNFDHAVAPDKRTGSEGWAEEVFLGLQYAPLFTWLSAGAPVVAPKFHTPGSHGLLEIADALSFFVAREFHQCVMGRKTEVPSSYTGLGYYRAFNADGGINSSWSRGLPIEKFYPALISRK